VRSEIERRDGARVSGVAGMVNVFLIVSPDGLTMIDAGLRKSWSRIEEPFRELGKRPERLVHPGYATAQEATGARVWMHPSTRHGTGW